MRKKAKPRRAPPADHAELRWNEAVEHFVAGRFGDAENSALKMLDFMIPSGSGTSVRICQALHLAALSAYKQQAVQEAIARLQRCVQQCPHYAAAWKDLASIYFDGAQWDQVQECLHRYIAIEPKDVGALGMLATAMRRSDRPAEAADWFQQALALAPGDWRLHEGLAIVLQNLKQWKRAEEELRRAIQCQPDVSDLHRQLVALLRQIGDLETAAQAANQWLQVEPDSATAQHIAAALNNQAVPTRASDQYIMQLFDQFSENFDQALTELHYRAPQLIANVIEQFLSAQSPCSSLLDAGCGTGLCGQRLRPLARRLVGVDLSEGMLARAKGLSLYDELVQMELTSYLTQHAEQFDWIVACDTLNYFGDLRAVLTAARQALTTGGRLLFTLELDEESVDDLPESPGSQADYRLCPTGRYRHCQSAAERMLEQAQLQLLSCTGGVLRTEAGQPVHSLILLCTH